MNTPSHIVFNLALMDKKGNSNRVFPIFLGSILPDLPIFVLFFIERFIRETPQSVIWGEIYFSDKWQMIIDLFNSIPLVGIVILFSVIFLKKSWKSFFLLLAFSMLLHIFFDLFLHNDDAHRHFLPFSNWKFISPISYWDVQHHAYQVVIFEVVLSIIACFVIIFKKRALIPTLVSGLLILVFGFYAWSFYQGYFNF